MGRPSDYSTEIADEICERIAEGESLRKICLDERMPSKSAVFRWLAMEENKIFRDQYAHARNAQADALADEIVDIADEAEHDVIVGKDGRETVNQEAIARSRLRVDARKWVASKLKPKAYGDRQQVDTTHSGSLDHKIEYHIVDGRAD